MAAYAALVSLMNTIQDIHKHPQISTFFDRIHTQTLFEKTSLLLDFIEADNYGKEAEDLEREITSAAQAAEEAIDFYIMDQIYAETSETSLDLQQKIRSMDVVLINVNEFKGKPRSGEKQHTPVLELEIEETVMVGLDAEFESLLDELTRDPQSNRKTISIVGMGGMEIWKMRQLRHLECGKFGKIYLPPYNRPDEDELLILENLQTLTTVVNPRLCMEVCKIIPNIIKLYLCYDESLYEYDDCLIEYLCNLDRMHKLESLKLVIFNNKLNKRPTFPNSLKKLSLERCRFNWDDLTTIGLLSQLEVLILSSFSVVGDRWSPTTGQFLRLKFLKLDQIDLKYWDADNSHFPVLEKLHLCFIFYLEDIPMEIGDIPTLELILVDYCNDSVEISAVRIKEDQLDKGNDSLQIQIGMLKSDLEEFTEKVELEGLSIRNLQLELDMI